MSDSPLTRPPLPSCLRRKHRLLTRAEVLAVLRTERIENGLTATAHKYQLSPQQVNDVLSGRAKLSKRMTERIGYKMWVFYEKKKEGE